jgi:hypothetical protein
MKPAPHLACLALAAALLAAPSAARAGTTPAQLYDQAVAAEEKGRHDEAARLFARADALSPSPGALLAALEAALKSGDAALGLELVDRAEARNARGRLAKLKDAARTRFTGRAGRLETSCDTCTVTVDGRARAPGPVHWLAIGPHTVELGGPKGASERRTVQITAGEAATIELPAAPEPPAVAEPVAPAEPAAATASDAGGPRAPEVSSAWFWTGLAVTAGLGLGTGFSVVDAMGRHEAATKTTTSPLVRSAAGADTRTRVLIAATAVVGATTLGIGIFAVKWRDKPAEVSVAAGPGGGGVRVAGSF